jgi:endonuclease/exonuclease/phosphatase family metal-dependent hydrolase
VARLVHAISLVNLTQLTVLSWNVFHGRDAPPDRAIHRAAWRMSGTPLDDGVYLQVNRSLEDEFVETIAGAGWSVCLLQEAPPAWASKLGRRCGADVFRALTSRNQLRCITRLIARWRPDLLGSWEGGSNVILVRPPWRSVPGSTRSLLLSSLTERGLSERRRLIFVRLRSDTDQKEICVANLHASAADQASAEREVRRAARLAVEWAGEAPLVLGGDFNLKPEASTIFDELESDLGLSGVRDAGSIDHLLTRAFDVVRPAEKWPDERRDLEVPWGSGRRRIRLSDHAPIEVVLRTSVQKLPMRYK